MSILLLLSISTCFATHAQQVSWSTASTVATSSYSNEHPRIALDRNNNPLVLWGNSGNNRAYFSKWNGSAFTTPVTMNPSGVLLFAASWAGPDLTAYGDTVYVSVKQTPEDTGHIYLARSTNGGASFSMPVRADYIGMNVSRFPILTTDNSGNPIMAFMKFNMGFRDARYVVSKSSDLGNSFGADVLATKSGDSVCDCCPASILCSGNNIVMNYRANEGNIRDVWSCISTNGGSSFGNTARVDQNSWNLSSCPASGPDGVIIGDTVYTVFMNGSSGKSLVYFGKACISTATAASTQAITGNFSGLLSQNYPRIASNGYAAAMVWTQSIGGVATAVMKFTDDIRKGFPAKFDTVGIGNTTNADVAMAPGKVHVVWEDDGSMTVKYRMGTYTLPSSVTNIHENKHLIDIYPNPTKDFFTANITGIGNCILLDVQGKATPVNFEQKGSTTTVHIQELNAGRYVVVLTNKEGTNYYANLTIAE